MADEAGTHVGGGRGRELRRLLPGVADLFDRVRSGLRARSALRGVEAALVAGLVYGSLGLVLDRVVLLPAGVRYAGLAGAGAVVGLILLARLTSSAIGKIGPLYLAARVEQRYPGLQGRIISAVEMAASGEPAEGATALVYRQAERLAPEVDVAKVVAGELERTRVHRALFAAMALTLVAALAMGDRFPTRATRCLFPWLDPAEPDAAFARIWPREVRVPEGRAFFVRARVAGEVPHRATLVMDLAGRGSRDVPMRPSRGGAEWVADVEALEGSGVWRVRAEFASGRAPLVSDPFPATLLVTPRPEKITASYAYPGYSGRPPSSHEGGAVDTLVGTTVTLEMRPNTPLSSASLNVAGDGTVAMSRAAAADGGEVWRAGFRVRRPGSYTIDLASAEGIAGRSRAYPIVARGDAEPSCDAVYEARAPGEALSLGARFRVTATDDLGLREFVLVVKRGKEASGDATPAKPGADTFCIDVPGFEPGRREVDLAAVIPPQLLPLEAGVTYTYYVRAADGYGPPPHLATSEPRTFRVEEAKPQGLLAREEHRKKKRPPLLEPKDDTARRPPSADGSGGAPPPPSGGSPPPPGRRLAGLLDPPGSGGSPPPPKGGGEQAPGEKPKPSRYASQSGLQGDQKDGGQGGQQGDQQDGRQANQPGGGQGGGQQASSGGQDGGGQGGGRGDSKGGQPQLPGEGTPGGGAGGRPKAGRPGEGGDGAGGGGEGAGDKVADAGGGSRSGFGGGDTPLPEGSDSGSKPAGGGRNTGLPREMPTGGGTPDGSEKGGGPPPGPETVDDAAVAALNDIKPEEIESTSVPGRPRERTRDRETGALAGTGSADAARTDLGTGASRAVGALAGADRIAIPKDELPSMEVVRSRPVSRAYRALVGEYMRRLQELAE
ncbi:MAG: hypothetical protein ACYTKD_12310 [Planctomycetota bacterium]